MMSQREAPTPPPQPRAEQGRSSSHGSAAFFLAVFSSFAATDARKTAHPYAHCRTYGRQAFEYKVPE